MDVAQFVERRTSTAAKDFFSPSAFIVDSLTMSVNPCVQSHALASVHAHVTDPVVHVSVRWIMEALKHQACIWESNPNFLWVKSPGDNTTV